MRYVLDVRRLDQRQENYRHAVGVLESPPAGPSQSGWWTPAATIAMRTGTFYTTDFSRFVPAEGFQHSAYYLLPATYEDRLPHQQDVLVEAQADELMNSAPEIIDVFKELVK
jgi:hypothetical protein